MIDGPAYAVVVAAGRSERMGGTDKIFAELAGRPLLAWTLRAFALCEAIEGIVVVGTPVAVGRLEQLTREWRFAKVSAVVAGGETRQASVRAGVEAAEDAAIVAVHDGARPLVTPELVTRGVELARAHGAAVCAMLSRDTVKQANETGNVPIVGATLDRERIWLAQTPQVFVRELLLRAHRQAERVATDDAALVEALGERVLLYEGDTWNLKVTTPDDLLVAEAILRERFTR